MSSSIEGHGKDLWVKALESNTYSQGKNRLRNRNAFCVFGVLGDLYAKQFPGYAHWEGNKFCFDVVVQRRPLILS